MMKSKLMFPLAAFLMLPAMTSCGPDKYQASFNTDQHISLYGPQFIDITLDKNVKSKMHFKDSLNADMFEMPEKYSDKEISSAYSYNNGSSAVIIFAGDAEMTGDEDTFNIKVKESAFKEPNLGGEISVTMYKNRIQYTEGYIWKDENDDVCFRGLINLVGELVEEFNEVHSDDGDGDYFKVTCTKGEVKGFTVNITDMRDRYLLDVTIDNEGGELTDSKFNLTFKGGSTNLDNYECTIELAEHPSKSYYTFIPTQY